MALIANLGGLMELVIGVNQSKLCIINRDTKRGSVQLPSSGVGDNTQSMFVGG